MVIELTVSPKLDINGVCAAHTIQTASSSCAARGVRNVSVSVEGTGYRCSGFPGIWPLLLTNLLTMIVSVHYHLDHDIDQHERTNELGLLHDDPLDSTNLVYIVARVQPTEVNNLGAPSFAKASFERITPPARLSPTIYKTLMTATVQPLLPHFDSMLNASSQFERRESEMSEAPP
ncbi:hypothetical protein NM688_g7441 [Phlebia brevispora]|uniref:Uncharacterized protein n=1 Tax=Phlebia brevispora TaxID=194682 RepID=A0ACC1S5B1_9APHY|nr:hypothetical protein NM688_g7441 [Phlebia brevispora]